MKILGCTSIRSDYDLLSPLYQLLDQDDSIDFRLAVSGAHLSEYYGRTIEQIENDKFKILCRIQTLTSETDDKVDRIKSASLLLTELIGHIQDFAPDLVIYAGDREDVLIYAMIAMYLDIPTIHFYSGDHAKDGYVDNPVRHASSKLSTYHFVALNEHKKRLIAIGESSERIFTIGSIALDRFKNFKLHDKLELERHFRKRGQLLKDAYALAIFHPLGEAIEDSGHKFECILKALKRCGIQALVSYPNTDPNNSKIREIILNYENDDGFIFYKNLDRDLFLSLFRYSKFIIGNSSSGIHEAASIPIPAVNVGARQTGRHCGKNVRFINGGNVEEITEAIQQALSDEYLDKIKDIKNPYGDGHSAQKAYDLIKKIDLKRLILKKEDPLKVLNE